MKIKKGEKTVLDYLMKGGVEGVLFITESNTIYTIKSLGRKDIGKDPKRSITTDLSRFKPYKSDNYTESENWESSEGDLAFRLQDPEVIIDK